MALAASPYNFVWGNWVVPAVIVPNDGIGDYYSSLWVGLNGASLLQAGTEQDASYSPPLSLLGETFGGSATAYYAWFEWFPAPSVQVQNFPVAPGQAITVWVGALDDGSNQGFVGFYNRSLQIASTGIVVPIPTTDFNGNTITPAIAGVPSDQAAWILERPSTAQNGVPVANELCDFGEAVMVNATAIGTTTSAGKVESSTITVGQNDQGTLLNMLADDGVTVIAQADEGPELEFYYTG
jgi:hypothetical protein